MREEAETYAQDSEEDEGGAKIDSSTTTAYEDSEEDTQWVSVVEPVTANTLVDTILAQLATLTTLCSIVTSSLASGSSQVPIVRPSIIEASASKLLEDALPTLFHTDPQELQPRKLEVALTKATLSSNLLELAFRTEAIDTDTYTKELDNAFSSADVGTTSSPDILLAHSRAIVAWNSALIDSTAARSISDGDIQRQANMRWNMLSKAQKLLTTAASLPSTKEDTAMLATTHLLRADTSLLLHALYYGPTSFPQAISNASQLLKNAEVFYRNATRLFSSLIRDEGQAEKEVSEFRGAVVAVLQNKATSREAEATLRASSSTKSDEWRREQLQDMADEGLILSSTFGLQ